MAQLVVARTAQSWSAARVRKRSVSAALPAPIASARTAVKALASLPRAKWPDAVAAAADEPTGQVRCEGLSSSAERNLRPGFAVLRAACLTERTEAAAGARRKLRARLRTERREAHGPPEVPSHDVVELLCELLAALGWRRGGAMAEREGSKSEHSEATEGMGGAAAALVARSASAPRAPRLAHLMADCTSRAEAALSASSPAHKQKVGSGLSARRMRTPAPAQIQNHELKATHKRRLCRA